MPKKPTIQRMKLHPEDLRFLADLVFSLALALSGHGGGSHGTCCCEECLAQRCLPLISLREEEEWG